jgi:hypothetical protein
MTLWTVRCAAVTVSDTGPGAPVRVERRRFAAASSGVAGFPAVSDIGTWRFEPGPERTVEAP